MNVINWKTSDRTEYVLRFEAPGRPEWINITGGAKATQQEAVAMLAKIRGSYPKEYRWRVVKRVIAEETLLEDAHQ